MARRPDHCVTSLCYVDGSIVTVTERISTDPTTTDPTTTDPTTTEPRKTEPRTTEPRTVAWFDAAPVDQATAAVEPVCASRRWIAALLAGRPFGSLAALNAASDAALDGLDWPDLDQALAAHPRIGERADGNSTEARWSRAEQAGAAGAMDNAGPHDDLADRLGAANVEYEEHFGFVFLICATGKDAREVLSQIEARMSNTAAAEHEVVRAELKEIVALRLARSFA